MGIEPAAGAPVPLARKSAAATGRSLPAAVPMRPNKNLAPKRGRHCPPGSQLNLQERVDGMTYRSVRTTSRRLHGHPDVAHVFGARVANTIWASEIFSRKQAGHLIASDLVWYLLRSQAGGPSTSAIFIPSERASRTLRPISGLRRRSNLTSPPKSIPATQAWSCASRTASASCSR
jgi:hypothetical protein